MTGLLKKAFDEASKLPKDEQESLAKLVLEEIKSERRWDQAFSSSAERLSELADEALDEDRRGETEELKPEKL